MKRNIRLIHLYIVLLLSVSCTENETAVQILQRTINSIDTIETIYYKQDMSRTNPRNIKDTIFRYREMYFKRLVTDSIVGVKGHWYMYVNDKQNVFFEDVYNGNRLIRKNNRDSVAMVYDLVEYPDFKGNLPWGHNTLYGMQYELKYILDNKDSYAIERLNDTIIGDKNCFQVEVNLRDKVSMPSFAARLEEKEGNISTTIYYLDKKRFYPVKMKGISYNIESPDQKYFIDQNYYDIKFNLEIDEDEQFNTSDESVSGYSIIVMKP